MAIPSQKFDSLNNSVNNIYNSKHPQKTNRACAAALCPYPPDNHDSSPCWDALLQTPGRLCLGAFPGCSGWKGIAEKSVLLGTAINQ